MNRITLPQLVAMADNLPSIPRVVTQILQELDQEEPQIKRIATLIAMDPSLMARMIKLANSAFVGAKRQVHSVEDAFQILGFSHLRALVTAIALGSTFKSVPGINMEHFWRYSLNTAKMAKSLARSLKMNDGAAMTAGLVHAIGELILYLGIAPLMAPLKNIPIFDLNRLAYEHKLLGFDSYAVSATFVEQWQFPENIVYAVKHIKAPFEDGVYDPMAGVLHMAAWRARALELDLDEPTMSSSFPHVIAMVLQLDMNKVLHEQPSEWASSSEVALMLD